MPTSPVLVGKLGNWATVVVPGVPPVQLLVVNQAPPVAALFQTDCPNVTPLTAKQTNAIDAKRLIQV